MEHDKAANNHRSEQYRKKIGSRSFLIVEVEAKNDRS